MPNKKLFYISFQSFPSISANSIQSMKMIKYFNRAGYQVELIHPGRKSLEENISISEYYKIPDEVSINEIKWFLNFDQFRYFKSIYYVLSHFLWTMKVMRTYINNSPDTENALFFTRSNWALYFLAKRNYKVIFELHKLSKTTSFVFKKIKNNPNVGYVVLNKFLLKDSNLNKTQQINLEILPNSFDEEDFTNYPPRRRNPNSFIFIGRLTRYGEDRNIQFLIDAFNSDQLKNYTLTIVGGPVSEYKKLYQYVEKNNINNVKILNHIPQNEIAEVISEFEAGILINSSDSNNTKLYTSPLKYFEYLAAGLSILAVDFESHKILPFADKISFFKENDYESFEKAVKNIEMISKPDADELKNFSYSNRISSIDKLFARLEGFEPPTL